MEPIVRESTRFYITQGLYDELCAHPQRDFKLLVKPNLGQHPRGHYLIPHAVIKKFIASKQGTPNWNKHQNFKQDSVPSELKDYFFK